MTNNPTVTALALVGLARIALRSVRMPYFTAPVGRCLAKYSCLAALSLATDPGAGKPMGQALRDGCLVK